MPQDPDAGPRPARTVRSYAVVVFAVIIGLSLGVLSVGSIGWVMLSGNSGRALLSHVWSAVTGRTLSIDVSQPTVVDRIQRLQRLETVVYTMDKVVTGAKENPIFPDFLAGDRLLMLVHGEVVAGIDFTDLKLGDVRVNGKQIQLHLPRAASVPDSDRQREDAGLFQANWAAGTHRPESGNASAPGGGTSTARGRNGRWHFANRPAECRFYDP